MNTLDRAETSPDGQHRLRLTYLREIRFGESYYHLELDGRRFGDRIFTDNLLWSTESNSLIIEEWIFEGDFPYPHTSRLMRIPLIDPSKESTLVELYRGPDPTKRRDGYPILEPIRWKDGELTYRTLELASNGSEVLWAVHQARPAAA